MSKQSLNDFLKVMAEKPQTLGWDVMAAFDRDQTNYLLLQEYISRFGNDSLFDPVSGSESTGGITHTLDGLQLDKPRLSFDNAVITASRARCVMRTVGGKIYETTTPQGTTRKEVKRFGLADGLVGPVLTMTINLRNTPGSVTTAGTVELDLAGNGAADFEFAGVDTSYEAAKLGSYLQKVIETWGDEQKRFQLGQLRKNSADLLQPGEFRVLTRPAPGATARHADNFGDGEVLLLIGLDDRYGELPSSNTSIPYLLPEGYSSNLVISFAEVVSRLMIDAIKGTAELRDVKFDEIVEGGGFTRFVANDGGWNAQITVPGWDLWHFEYYNSVLPFTSDTKLTLERHGDGVRLVWAGSTEFDGRAVTRVINPPNPPQEVSYNGRVRVHWDVNCLFKPTLVNDTSGRPVIVINGEFIGGNTRGEFVSGSGDRAGEGYFKAAVTGVGESIERRISTFRQTFENIGFTLDAFRLNGLLFPDESVVVPRTIAQPGDLTALGDLGPHLTGNRLSHNEISVAAGSNHTFTVIPALAGVEWFVDALPGDPTGDVNTGTIGRNTGVYTAPAAVNFGYTFRRVIVTAKKGDWSAKALVHLVATPVSVFPLVNTVNLTTEEAGKDIGGYVVWAASTNGGALNWNVTGNAGGTLSVVDDPNVQEARQYWAPKEFPTGGTGQLEKVLRVDTIEIKQGNGTPVICEMLLPKAPSASYYIKQDAVAQGIQFEFWVLNDDNEHQPVAPSFTKWHKVSGRGELSATGLYTPPATGKEHYIVVAAFFDVPGLPTALWNFKILPLPFDAQLSLEGKV